ncbi:MAG: glutathione-disulfide reductase [Alphaproteobacteria bacterium]|nr:glutathione-disulfide reductase [Alphaproteobacteria bacterium]
MDNFDYDLLVIGGGSGGVRAARLSGERGARVALVEATALGGTCVNAGCIPKKFFAYAAGYADEFADAVGYGWGRAAPAFNWAKLVAAKDVEIARLNGVYERVLKKAGVEIIFGRAAFEAPQRVAIGPRSLRARQVLIATGGAPLLPDIPGCELAFTSDAAFHLPAVPAKVLIIGGGYVATEFASIFSGLGAAVVLAHRGPRLLKGFDHELTARLATALAARGIEVMAGVEPTALERDASGIVTQMQDGRRVAAPAVMLATGRAPVTQRLGLDRAGIDCAPSGAVRVDERFRTSQPWAFAIGDAIDRLQLTPVALAEAGAAVAAIFAENARPLDYARVPRAVFCRPTLASVGLSEEQARAAGTPIRIFRQPFRPLLSRLSGRTEETLVKLVVDASTDHVLGAHMLGPEAPEIIQGLAVALTAGATKADFDATLAIHPTAAEEFVTLRKPV